MLALRARMAHFVWIPAVAFALGWALSHTPLFDQLEARVQDADLRLTARQHYFRDALVIDIDDASLRTLQPVIGGWPYQRDVYAVLLDYLTEMGARTVVFDMLFGDPRDGDAQLREAINRAPSVVLAATAIVDPSQTNSKTDLLGDRAWHIPAGTPSHAWSALHAPLSNLQSGKGTRVGVASVVTDSDGVLRKTPLFHQFNGRTLPFLPLAALVSGEEPIQVHWNGKDTISVDEYLFPVDQTGNIYPYYPRNTNSILSMPFSRVASAMLGLPGQVIDPEFFQGKTVFVGSSALNSDWVQTPVGEMNGLYLLAVLHQAMKYKLLLMPPKASWNGFLLFIALIPAFMLMLRPRSGLAGVSLSLAAGVAIYATHLGILSEFQQQSALLLPITILIFAGLLEMAWTLQLVHTQRNTLIHGLARVDALTGLPNRSALQLALAQAIEHAVTALKPIAVMVVDLDRFKSINDPLGRDVGDQILVETGLRLKSSAGANDIVARLGSDEFCVLIHDAERKAVEQFAKQALAALAAPYRISNQDLHITSSAGISLFPKDGSDGATLLKNADYALHRAKVQGRNDYCFFTHEFHLTAMEQLQIENDLHFALARNELQLYYQPQRDMQNGQFIGVEALIRWNHPSLGLLTPGRFIPVAEQSGLILELGKWVLETACSQIDTWRKAGLTQIERVAVNFSARQFEQPDLPELVENTLLKFQLDPTNLEIEITESVAMKDLERSIQVLRTLKQMGVTLSIDDFGTGHSSLTYLKQLPVDILKIDGSFVHGLETDPSDAEICASTIALAHKLGLKVVAEGIETTGQFEFLKGNHCDTAQGYLISYPVPADEIPSVFLLPITS